MRVKGYHHFNITLFILFLLSGMASFSLSGQEREPDGLKAMKAAIQEKLTSGNVTTTSREPFYQEAPDTNFTYEKYAAFLSKISDTSKFIVLPIDEFRKKIDPTKIVIGLRHDVDVDLKKAFDFSKTETKMGFRSTYYILHTANYYLADPANKAVHTDSIIPLLKEMQNKYHFEIGWHNDLVTLQIVYHIDPVQFLHQELDWLRSNGIRIPGTASHGSNYCRTYSYVNFYFFEECTWPIVGQYVNNVNIPDGSNIIPLKKGKLSDFNLDYEAYFLNNNKYYSDASFTNGKRWDISMLDVSSLKPGDRMILLIHPIHWHKASTEAEILSFNLQGEKNSTIDPVTKTVNVVMPYGSVTKTLVSYFTLSQGAYAKVLGTQQTSGSSRQNYTTPVAFTVYSENRSVTAAWKVKVEMAKNTAAGFESFSMPGYSRQVTIDKYRKTIDVKVSSIADITNMPVQFTLSDGASVWLGKYQQFSNAVVTDFTQPVIYKVVAEDGVTVNQWQVTVEKENSGADILSFSLPGMKGAATIDRLNRNILVVMNEGEQLKSIPALFTLSPGASLYLNNARQISGLSISSFEQPVIFTVVSEDSIKTKKWTIFVSREPAVAPGSDLKPAQLKVYPDAVRGKAIIKIENITEKESRIEIFNSQGKRVFENTFTISGTYVEEVDISGFAPGVYVVKCSSLKDSVVFVL